MGPASCMVGGLWGPLWVGLLELTPVEADGEKQESHRQAEGERCTGSILNRLKVKVSWQGLCDQGSSHRCALQGIYSIAGFPQGRKSQALSLQNLGLCAQQRLPHLGAYFEVFMFWFGLVWFSVFWGHALECSEFTPGPCLTHSLHHRSSPCFWFKRERRKLPASLCLSHSASHRLPPLPLLFLLALCLLFSADMSLSQRVTFPISER